VVQALSPAVTAEIHRPSTLLDCARQAAEARAAAISESKRKMEKLFSESKHAVGGPLPVLPKVAAKKTHFDQKALKRYFSLLLQPCGRKGSDVRVNVASFCNQWSAFLLAKFSMEHCSKQLFDLNSYDTVPARVAYVLKAKAIMAKSDAKNSKGEADVKKALSAPSDTDDITSEEALEED